MNEYVFAFKQTLKFCFFAGIVMGGYVLFDYIFGLFEIDKVISAAIYTIVISVFFSNMLIAKLYPEEQKHE